jgi:hypothetical protein
LDGSVAIEKNKIQNKKSSVTSIKWLCARCGNCENGWWRVISQMLPRKSKLRYQKELGKIMCEWKLVSERQWAKVKWTKKKPSPIGN